MRLKARIVVKDFERLRAAICSQIRKAAIKQGGDTRTLDIEELEAAALCWLIVELQRGEPPALAIWRSAYNALAGRSCWHPSRGGQDLRQANYRPLTEGRTYRLARANAAAAH